MDLTKYWNKVQKTSSCWFWVGARTNGYGVWRSGDMSHLVHKLSYEIHNGKVPAGLEVDHLCGNRNCVNPEHLEAVTHLVNSHRSRIKTKGTSKPLSDNARNKKFLLYIHNPKFKDEVSKSGLVNKLLDEHYSSI